MKKTSDPKPKSLEELANEASEAGMSYGQYVAQMQQAKEKDKPRKRGPRGRKAATCKQD